MKMTYLTYLMGLSLFFSIAQGAENQKTIMFDGQAGDQVDLETIVKITKYRTEEYDATCTRQVQTGTREECGMETRYRQECRWEPAYERCWTENERQCRTVYERECRSVPNRVCRNVTKYRRQCTRGSSRQVCTTKPGGTTCRTDRNGNRVCRRTPDRRVCRTEPGRQTCRDVPYTDRVCNTTYRNVCDSVPRTRCTNVPRRRCVTEPGRNVCSQVPYQQRVCRQVPVYKTEEYACKKTRKVPYEADKTIAAKIDIDFKDAYGVAKGEFKFRIKKSGEIVFEGKDLSEPTQYITVSKNLSTNDTEDEMMVTGTYSIEFLSLTQLAAPVKTKYLNFKGDKDYISFESPAIKKGQDISFKVLVERKNLIRDTVVVLNKVVKLDQLDVSTLPNGNTKIGVNLKKLGRAATHTSRKLTIKLTSTMTIKSEVINPPKDNKITGTQKFRIKLN